MNPTCGMEPLLDLDAERQHRPACDLQNGHEPPHRFGSALDHLFPVVVADAEEAIEKGATAFQKFTCVHCGARQTMDVPNRFFTEGKCEECGGVTDILTRGCNYILIISNAPADVMSDVLDHLGGSS